MKDLFLKATSLEALQIHLISNDVIKEAPEMISYFQNEDLVIDWIGKVPQTTDAETGEVLTWYPDYRFNVRLLDETNTLFDTFTNVFPETPYRVFS